MCGEKLFCIVCGVVNWISVRRVLKILKIEGTFAPAAPSSRCLPDNCVKTSDTLWRHRVVWREIVVGEAGRAPEVHICSCSFPFPFPPVKILCAPLTVISCLLWSLCRARLRWVKMIESAPQPWWAISPCRPWGLLSVIEWRGDNFLQCSVPPILTALSL